MTDTQKDKGYYERLKDFYSKLEISARLAEAAYTDELKGRMSDSEFKEALLKERNRAFFGKERFNESEANFLKDNFTVLETKRFENIDVSVFRNKNSKELFIAIDGTDLSPSSFSEWTAGDFRESYDLLNRQKVGLLSGYYGVSSKIADWIGTDIIPKYDGIFNVTGHSLGGTYAQLTGGLLYSNTTTRSRLGMVTSFGGIGRINNYLPGLTDVFAAGDIYASAGPNMNHAVVNLKNGTHAIKDYILELEKIKNSLDIWGEKSVYAKRITDYNYKRTKDGMGRDLTLDYRDYDSITDKYGHDPYRDSNCFVAGTMISMADGTKKPIEKVKVGDSVMSFQGTKDKPVGKKVTFTSIRHNQPLYQITLADGRVIIATGDHPFLVIPAKKENQQKNGKNFSASNSNKSFHNNQNDHIDNISIPDQPTISNKNDDSEQKIQTYYPFITDKKKSNSFKDYLYSTISLYALF
ncbi:MAG: hypothetical protein K1X44_01570 [Alphaproteobacteria bacterium]|nr:hypothetical protein [Alphaproteobacteria bacterium]